MSVMIRECTDKCRSSHLVDMCITALTKCTDKQFKLLTQLCTNSLTSLSSDGRTALHMAASLGKTELIEWMAEQDVRFMDIDAESNWTALHRALFYGHVSTARLLITAEPTLLNTLDNEGRTPLDLVVADRPIQTCYSPNHELYSWGENTNFTLGQASEQARVNPEVITDVTGVNEVIMRKYHTLILTSQGQVLSCGHGWGGRLGHANEATVLTPKLISALKNERIVSVAAARDHSVFLTAGNTVLTCGINEHYQLGQEGDKLLQPKTIKFQPFRKHRLEGVCAGRFHTAVWSSDGLYTFGLNAGQLGHQKGEKYQTTPRLVSGIQKASIARVVSSDAAILCCTRDGDLVLIHEFRIRKIAANWTVEKLLVCGGKLDKSELDVLQETGGKEVSVGVMNTSRQIFLWRQSDPELRRVNFSGLPWLSPQDFHMSRNCLLLASVDGQVFRAVLHAERRKFSGKNKTKTKDPLSSDQGGLSLSELCRKDETCYVDLTRIRGLHRACAVFMDDNAANFMAVQSLPNENLTLVPEVSPSEMTSHIAQLFSETSSDDVIHDVILESRNLRLPAHQLILSNGSSYFQSLFKGEEGEGELIRVDVGDLGNTDLLVQAITFIYTGTCDLLVHGTAFKFVLDIPAPDAKSTQNKLKSGNDRKDKSIYSVHKQETVNSDANPVKMLKELAKSLGVTNLVEKLNNISWNGGKVCVNGASKAITTPVFNRRNMLHLCDITLSSEDGQIFNCHKCILTARMEYFHSMLTCGWVESGLDANVTLPVIGSIFHVILQYLYTDDSAELRSNNDVEFLCNVLVAADQLLITRLKEICEVVICQHLTLKNVAEILEFSTVYTAQQLILACHQFICLNLTAILEARSLDIVSDEAMDALSDFYRSWIPGMCRRRITPYDAPPTLEDLERLQLEPVEVEDKFDPSINKNKSRRRRSSKSNSESKRDSITDVTVEMTSPEVTESEPLSPSSPVDVLNSPVSPQQTMFPVTWSAKSSGDVCSLRGIMEEEASRSRDHCSDRSAPGGRKKKLSQKERKRLALEADTAKSQAETDHDVDQTANIRSPTSPWATPASPWGSTTPPTAPSLRDLMNEETISKSAQKVKMKNPKGWKTNISWGLSQRGNAAEANVSATEPEVVEPANPWSKMQTDVNTSFTEIMQETISEKATLDRTARKPLHLIQKEEQAINELMKFYADNNAKDVKITVERVTSTAAKPTWAAKQ